MYKRLNREFEIDSLTKTGKKIEYGIDTPMGCLLYTSPSPRD